MESNELIFGVRAVIEAVQAGKTIDKILVKKDIQSELSKELFETIRGKGINVQRVPVEKLNRMVKKNHQGVVAFMAQVTYQNLTEIVPALYDGRKTPFLVLLDGITDVRNFGAIARSCECAGVDAIIIPSKNSVSVTADAIKTSAGALHKIPVCKVQSVVSAMRFLKESGVKLVAATESGKENYTQADYKAPVCIVMGAEDKGIPFNHIELCDEKVSIPLRGSIASLNVSVAAGVLMYEVVRQRG